VCVCVSGVYVCSVGQSSPDIAASESPVQCSRHDKLTWSSLFHSKSQQDLSSWHHQHTLPVHAGVGRPFKPVGYNPQCTTVNSSERVCRDPPQTVDSECPLPAVCTTPNSSSLSSMLCHPNSASSECPLHFQQTTPESSPEISKKSLPQTVLSECPLPSMHTLSSDSSSEEDPTVESRLISSKLRSPQRVLNKDAQSSVPSQSKLSAAARISLALSKSDCLPKSQSHTDITHRPASSQPCHVAPSTRMSVALSAQSSAIGRRLSTMLHNNRLRHQSSSAGMIKTKHFLLSLLFTYTFSALTLLLYDRNGV